MTKKRETEPQEVEKKHFTDSRSAGIIEKNLTNLALLGKPQLRKNKICKFLNNLFKNG
ncbi:MAG: hypothetical protein CM15mP130_2850 [Verrucomicrobiota bacterium]|nr:MAG: hypothetical protein CM15mP130_2850 [Verrucomicrobiota bacterium]